MTTDTRQSEPAQTDELGALIYMIAQRLAPSPGEGTRLFDHAFADALAVDLLTSGEVVPHDVYRQVCTERDEARAALAEIRQVHTDLPPARPRTGPVDEPACAGAGPAADGRALPETVTADIPVYALVGNQPVAVGRIELHLPAVNLTARVVPAAGEAGDDG